MRTMPCHTMPYWIYAIMLFQMLCIIYHCSIACEENEAQARFTNARTQTHTLTQSWLKSNTGRHSFLAFNVLNSTAALTTQRRMVCTSPIRSSYIVVVVVVIVEPAWIRTPPSNEKWEQTEKQQPWKSLQKPIVYAFTNIFIDFQLFCGLNFLFSFAREYSYTAFIQMEYIVSECSNTRIDLIRLFSEFEWSKIRFFHFKIHIQLFHLRAAEYFPLFNRRFVKAHNRSMDTSIHKSVLCIIQIHTLERIIVTILYV